MSSVQVLFPTLLFLLTYYKNTFHQGVSNDGGSHVETSSICAVPLGGGQNVYAGESGTALVGIYRITGYDTGHRLLSLQYPGHLQPPFICDSSLTSILVSNGTVVTCRFILQFMLQNNYFYLLS